MIIDYESFVDKIFQEMYKHKVKVNFKRVEKSVIHLKTANHLTYTDLEKIGNDKAWPFSTYWMWPTEDQIGDKLKQTALHFSRLPDNEESEIRKLDSIFKNIALVSIILRFVYPEYYGIYSPPNLEALQIKRGRTNTEDYLNYTTKLRMLKDTLLVSKVADIDTIIWAYQHRNEETEYTKFLESLLPKNVTINAVFANNTIKTARSFLAAGHCKHAGLCAAYAFNNLLLEMQIRNRIVTVRGDFQKEIIEKSGASFETREKLDEARRLRNRTKDKKEPLTAAEVKLLINNIEEVSRRLQIKID